MRVLAACSLGGEGHLRPLLAFMDAAARRGDERLLVGPAGLEPTARSAGHRFRTGGEPPEEEVASIRERLPVEPADVASVLGNRELFGRLATAAMLPAMEEAFAAWSPDLVLREPCEYASAVVARRAGVPCAQVAITVAQGEERSIRAAAPALDHYDPALADELRAAPYLTRFPASLDPSPFPVTLRYRVPDRPSPRPLPDWWGGSTAPLVYLTFGTVLGYMPMAAAVYRAAAAAVRDLPARVLLTVGHRVDPSVVGPVPGNVHVEPWVEQADVLASADLVVCHGGSGTVYGALADGVPLVVVPLFADQFENGRRIADAGAGRLAGAGSPDPDARRWVFGEAQVPAVAALVGAALGEPSLRRRAGEIAREMGAAPMVDEVLASVAAGDRSGAR